MAIARPGYPCYRNVLTALGCEVVELPAGPESRFQPTVEMLEALDEPVAGPGGGQPREPHRHDARARASWPRWRRWCEEHGVQLVSDEIYHGITYAVADASTPRAWETSREAVVFSSFSKYFSMTGWRIGWMLVPRAAAPAGRRAHRQLHDLPAGARAARRDRGVQRGVVRRVRRARRALRRQPAAAARRAAPGWASTGWHRPTARSTCTPTSGT